MGDAPHQKRTRLQEADWQDILPRALLAAVRFHRRYLESYSDAPTPHDLAQSAVADILSGKRRLPENVDLFVVLHEVIRSKVSNFIARRARRGTVDLNDEILAITAHASTDGMEDTSYEQFKDAVRTCVANDSFLERMIEYLFDDPMLKPADLAAMMDVEIKEIYNAYRRLRRHVAPLRSSN